VLTFSNGRYMSYQKSLIFLAVVLCAAAILTAIETRASSHRQAAELDFLSEYHHRTITHGTGPVMYVIDADPAVIKANIAARYKLTNLPSAAGGSILEFRLPSGRHCLLNVSVRPCTLIVY